MPRCFKLVCFCKCQPPFTQVEYLKTRLGGYSYSEAPFLGPLMYTQGSLFPKYIFFEPLIYFYIA